MHDPDDPDRPAEMDFGDDDFADENPADERAAPVRPVGSRRAAGGKMSGWAIAGIVALCTVPILCCVGGLVGSLFPAIGSARMAARRAQSQNNLKQIALAAHNFHSAHGALPPHVPPDGANLARTDALPGGDPANPRMAWLTAALPYMDSSNLWSRVDPALAFDDPAAAGVYGTRVPYYLSPTAPDDARPDGLAPAHYAGNALVLGEGLPGDLRGMTDGTTSTILAGEVNADTGSPAAWGDPDNLRDTADGINTPAGFGASWPGGAQFAFGDGSVSFISESIDPAVLKALGTPDGGETVDYDDF